MDEFMVHPADAYFLQLKKMDIPPKRKFVEDFQLQKGKHVHESFVPRFWFGWLRLCSQPIPGRSDHLLRQTQTGEVSVPGLSESGCHLPGNTFQTIQDGSDRIETGVHGL